MIFFFFGIVVAVFGGLATIVFLCALPFLRRPQHGANRFGSQSPTATVGQAAGAGFTRAFDFTGRSNRLDFFVLAIVVGILCGLSLCAVVILAYMARENPTWWSAAPLLLTPAAGRPKPFGRRATIA